MLRFLKGLGQKQKNAITPSRYIIQGDDDIPRFVSVISRELATYEDSDLITIYVARRSIDLHEQVKLDFEQRLKDSGKPVTLRESTSANILRQEQKIHELRQDIVKCSKAKWLRLAYAIKQLEALVAENKTNSDALINFYSKLANQVAQEGFDSIKRRSGVFSSEEIVNAAVCFLNDDATSDSTSAFVNIVNDYVPLNTSNSPIWEDIASRYGVVEVCKLDQCPPEIFGLLVTKQTANEWNRDDD